VKTLNDLVKKVQFEGAADGNLETYASPTDLMKRP
jgi:hypothetical protein